MATRTRTEAVRVVVRLRPRNVKEKKEHNPRVTHVQEDEEHVHIEDEEKGTAKSFRANQAFDGGCSQRQMFDLCGIKGLLDSAIEGFPVCAFAYGQTGSGKTHTIIGEEAFITRKGYRGSEVDGLIPRAGQYLFERMAAMTDRTFKLRATFLEIYNEQVYDLLNYDSHKPRPLHVRHSPKVGFFVEDLSEVVIESPHDLYVVLGVGIRNRRIASHSLNQRSSRGHCMLTVHIDSMPAGAGPPSRPSTGGGAASGDGLATYGRFTFVDLAGSERLGESNSKGQTAHETGHINKSLFNLGKVIAVLAKNADGGNSVSGDSSLGSTSKSRHSARHGNSQRSMRMRGAYGLSGRRLPMKRTMTSSASFHSTTSIRGAGGGVVSYRDSKLTMLLRDSLGGRSLALMIACCTPTMSAAHETKRTLQFAMGVKRIKNKAVVLLNPQEKLIASLRSEIKRLQEENERLRSGGAGLGILDIIASQGVSVEDLLKTAAENGNPEAASLANTLTLNSTTNTSGRVVSPITTGGGYSMNSTQQSGYSSPVAGAGSLSTGAGAGAGAGAAHSPTGGRFSPSNGFSIDRGSKPGMHHSSSAAAVARSSPLVPPSLRTELTPRRSGASSATTPEWSRATSAANTDGGDIGPAGGAPTLDDFLKGKAPPVPGPVELSTVELTELQAREAQLDHNIAILRERMFPGAAFDSSTTRATLRRDIAARGFTIKSGKRRRKGKGKKGRSRGSRRGGRELHMHSATRSRTTSGGADRGIVSVSPLNSTAYARTLLANHNSPRAGPGAVAGSTLPPLPPALSPKYAPPTNPHVTHPPGLPPQPSFPDLGISGYQVRGNLSPRARSQQLRLLKASLDSGHSSGSRGRSSRSRKREAQRKRQGMQQRHQDFTKSARILLQDVQQRRDGNFMF